jgi:hypothetical protein
MVYKYIRHPLYVGWALLFWATPTMSLGHLLFAGSLTAYMALAARIEERDLVKHFGRRYEEYRRRVGMFLPRLGRGRLAGREAAPAGLLQAAEAVPARREAGVRCLVQGPAALVSNVRGVTRLPRTNHGTEKVAAGDAATR